MHVSRDKRIYAPDAVALQIACDRLRAGDLVAVPTETVYGLAADATNTRAVQRIFLAKGRPHGHPLIVHVASVADARALARDWPAAADRLAAAFWPGPLTLVVRRGPRIPDAVTGGRDTVALRVPAHPVALALLRAYAGPLAAPSANRHEHLSPTRPEHVLASLGDAVDFVLDGGPTHAGIESSLVDLSVDPPRLLRRGPIDADSLRALLPTLRTEHVVESGAVHSAPGLSRRHYAPRIPLLVVARAELVARAQAPGVVWLARSPCPGRGVILPDSAAGFAEGLFAALHTLGGMPDARQILVESPPEGEAWAAVADRLGRASFS